MQLIGICLGNCDKKIRKNLKENTWYPFGNFGDCNGLFNENGIAAAEKLKDLKDSLKQRREFNSRFYSLVTTEEGKDKNIPININCIVGKNGSGKSSLLSIVYRIINNFSCRIKSHLNKYNQDYNPVWASGFNADLYYELGNEIYCIRVKDNEHLDISVADISKDVDNKICLLSEDGDVFSDEKKDDNDSLLLKKISEHFFYTVGTNYSLYSNSVVTDEWDEDEEHWLENIYHKNDGYFTPIVLVPYKSEGATIDTKKELSLAKERISTLSLLVYAQRGSDFIENLIPDRICYELTNSTEYTKYIEEKTKNTIDEYYENHGERNPLTQKTNDILSFIVQKIKKIFIEKYFSDEKNYKNSLKNDSLYADIKENTLAYLSYKIIKICLYYDEYKNRFPREYDNDILKTFFADDEKGASVCLDTIKKIVAELFSDSLPLNFTNLKIKQCITFLEKLHVYLIENKNEISTENFIKNLTKQNLSFDTIFENLPPAYFKKQFYFRKKDADAGNERSSITISSLSSGESQLLNSMSYAVYHIKNALTSEIQYRNINLIFDEAELYYHPEYQRTFVKDLLGIINRSNLSGVRGINITLVTHSPFILSDIPSQNILCLKEGRQDKNCLQKTLGANFYDLLKNQFFMDSSIGAVTEEIVNEILVDFNKIQCKDEKLITYEEKNKIRSKYKKTTDMFPNFYDNFIENLGDEYLNSTLKNIISIIRNETFKDRRKKELEDKIKKLEGENNAQD